MKSTVIIEHEILLEGSKPTWKFQANRSDGQPMTTRQIRQFFIQGLIQLDVEEQKAELAMSLQEQLQQPENGVLRPV